MRKEEEGGWRWKGTMQIGMRRKEECKLKGRKGDREVRKRGEDGVKEKKERFRNQKSMLLTKCRY